MNTTHRRRAGVAALVTVAAAIGAGMLLDWLSVAAGSIMLGLVGLLVAVAVADLRADRRLRRTENRLADRLSGLLRRDEALHSELQGVRQALTDRSVDTTTLLGLSDRLDEVAAGLSQLADTQKTLVEAHLDRLEDVMGRERTRIDRALQDERRRTVRQLEAAMGLNQILAGQPPLPQSSSWAASSDLLRFLYSLVRALEPANILECGSGVSSAVMGHAAAQGGSRVTCLEHEALYAAKTRLWVDSLGVVERVLVLDAPLVEHDVRGEVFQWYSTDELPDDRNIDLLVVDGPPGGLQPLSRYPAVPLLLDRLSDDVVVVLDDADREEEEEIVRRWLTLLPSHTSVKLPHVKGTAVLAPSGAVALQVE